MTLPDGVRIFVADQSLIDEVGHFYSYDRALALAAHELGVATLVLANKGVARSLVADADFKIEPWFSRTWRTDDRHPLIALASRLLRLPPARLTVPLLATLRGLLPHIAGQTENRNIPTAGRAPVPLIMELAEAVRHHRIAEHDVLFLHTVKAGVLAQVIDATDAIAGGARLRIVCLLRDLPTAAELDTLRAALGRRAHDLQAVRLASDSGLLAQRLSADLGIHVAEFPIPAAPAPIIADEPRNSGPFVVGYVGEARVDKGFTLLPDLIETVRQRTSGNAVGFAIHATLAQGLPSGEILVALDRIRSLLSPGDRLSNAALDNEAFGLWIDACDCIVLPYDVDRYRYATSGILIEALARGRPVVVPNATWMAANLPSGAGALFDHPDRLADAVLSLIDNSLAARKAARLAASVVKRHHSPRNLLETLLQTAGLQTSTDPPSRT